jgi:hypothetical protein
MSMEELEEIIGSDTVKGKLMQGGGGYVGSGGAGGNDGLEK